MAWSVVGVGTVVYLLATELFRIDAYRPVVYGGALLTFVVFISTVLATLRIADDGRRRGRRRRGRAMTWRSGTPCAPLGRADVGPPRQSWRADRPCVVEERTTRQPAAAINCCR